jgi:hypothetical protein
MPHNEAMLDEYQRTMGRIFSLAAAGVDPRLPIPACPAWDACGLVSHLVGTASFVASGKPLADDVQGWIDDEVRTRANRDSSSLAEEWAGDYPVVRAALTGQPSGGLVIDAVTHEQDLRSAIGPAATDHEAGLYAVLPALIDYARHLELFTAGPGVRLLTPTSDVFIGGSEVGLEVDLADDWELSRLLACRRSASQLDALPQKGDSALLYTLVSRYPLPEWPLDL